MKSLIVHFAKEHGVRVEIAGRCCEDPIFVGDELIVEGQTDSRLRVLSIEVYGKQVDCLHSGYVGNLFFERTTPYAALMKLVGRPLTKDETI